MATTQDYGIGEFTYPRGWFMVAEADKVTKEPTSLHFFGHDFALYRGESGRVVLLDAYCPHMGTNIACETTSFTAQDGRVEGDCIRCPYHGWRFGPDGKCNDIPYSKQPIPRAARLKSWPVVESMGAIYVWHDPEDGEPEWEAPHLEQWDDPSWVRWKFDDLGEVNCHQQEIIDNIADFSHLGPLHGSTVKYFENEFRGHVAIQRQAGGHRTLVGEGGKSPLLVTDTSYHGPGILYSILTGMQESVMYIAHTPVDDGKVKVWHALLVKAPSGAAEPTEEDVTVARSYQESSLAAFAQDFGIWSNKRPCLHGMYVSGDGPFKKARTWYKQFYNPRARKQEFLSQVEGSIYRADDQAGFAEGAGDKPLAEAVAEMEATAS